MPSVHEISPESLKAEWLTRLDNLVKQVQTWAEAGGWATRIIEKKMQESDIGEYQAPALLMQEGTTRILLEPIARNVIGADGLVDLYLMPAYDDIVSLYFYNGLWHVHLVEDEDKPFSEETFRQILDGLKKHAGQNSL